MREAVSVARMFRPSVRTQPATMDRPTTLKEKTGITAGAVAALVIVGWMIVLAIAILAAR
jgi:hypothetical protein